MYDYFVAPLRCPNCNTVSPATAITDMQTYIRGDADGSELPVGCSLDPMDLTVRHLVGADYKLIAPPLANGSLRLLDVWICPSCKTEQWAMIEVVQNQIERIEAVVLNRATLEAANFVSETDAELLAKALAAPADPHQRLDTIDILRQRLE